MQPEDVVMIVDDEPEVCRSLERLLKAEGIASRSYSSAEDFLDETPADQSGCLVLDVRLPGMSGLDLQRALLDRGQRLPIILISGHVTVSDTIRAFHDGVFRAFEKPFDDGPFLEAVHAALDRNCGECPLRPLPPAVDSLSDRQREVMQLLFDGLSVKQIAAKLQLSPSTVAKHRAKLLEKTGADSVMQLAQPLLRLDAGPPPPLHVHGGETAPSPPPACPESADG